MVRLSDALGRPSLRFLLLLVLALVLRGLPVVHAMPVATAAMGTDCAVSETSQHCPDHGDCHDHGDKADHAISHHGTTGTCQIACDLGAAPALGTYAGLAVAAQPSVRVAHRPVLALSDAPPPDHPPPIH